MEHPMFELLTDEENKDDPCISFMRDGTDEAKKVKRNKGTIWHAVFRKRDLVKDKVAIEKEMMQNFYSWLLLIQLETRQFHLFIFMLLKSQISFLQ